MKTCIKKSFFMFILAFLIGIQPSIAYSNAFGAIFPYKDYLIGGACALTGAYMVFKVRAHFDLLGKSNWSNMTLKDYIGPVPQEVADLIMQLKNPEAYTKMGVKLTKGFIFFGKPGTGKTHLARSIASEIDCPFFAITATDFKQPHVGEAKNVIRDLFKKARDEARQHPSHVAIIFIDELDAVGMRDSNRLEGGIDETINTLLDEMDGFDQHKDAHIVVIAATNILKNIDSALKRPGRFDHKVYIPYPNFQGRKLFIETFLQKYPSDATVSSAELATMTAGMSPADLVLLFDIAGRIAVKYKKHERDVACFDEALKQINRV